MARLKLVLVPALLAGLGAGQVTAQQSAVVQVGAARQLETAGLAPFSDSSTLVIRKDGASRPGSTIRTTLVHARRDGRDALLLVNAITNARGWLVDSSWVEPATLAPVAHRSYASSRDMSLDFDGRHVTGRYAPKDSAEKSIDQTLEVPAFDSSIWELLVASLPLEKNRSARLPLYIYERGGLVWMNTTVRGREQVNGESAWVVDSEMDGRTTTFWVSERPRRVIRWQSEVQPGVTMVKE